MDEPVEGMDEPIMSGPMMYADISGDSKEEAERWLLSVPQSVSEVRAMVKPPQFYVMSEKNYMELPLTDVAEVLSGDDIPASPASPRADSAPAAAEVEKLEGAPSQVFLFVLRMRSEESIVNVWLGTPEEAARDAWVEAVRKGLRVVQAQEERDKHGTKWEIDLSDVDFGKKVGAGAFGDVFKARLWGTEVAVKTMKSTTSSIITSLKREVAVLSQLRHPNVVLYIGACTTPPKVCIVTEWCGRSSLEDVIADTSVPIPAHKVVQWGLEVAQGMNYLHSLSPRIIHRDLKGANVFVDDKFTMKVGDFGLSHVDQHKSDMIGIYGTPAWTAPEVLASAFYDEKCDVYSYGMVMCELVNRKPPFHDLALKTLEDVKRHVLDNHGRPEIAPWLPAELKSLILSCLEFDPAARPPFQAVIDRLRVLLEKPEVLKKCDVARLQCLLGSSDAKLQQLGASEVSFNERSPECTPFHALPSEQLMWFLGRLTGLLTAADGSAEVQLAVCRALADFFTRLSKVAQLGAEPGGGGGGGGHGGGAGDRVRSNAFVSVSITDCKHIVGNTYGGLQALIKLLVHERRKGLWKTELPASLKRETLQQRRLEASRRAVLIRDKVCAMRQAKEPWLEEAADSKAVVERTAMQREAHRLLTFLLDSQMSLHEMREQHLKYLSEVLAQETLEQSAQLAELQFRLDTNRALLHLLHSRRNQVQLLHMLDEHNVQLFSAMAGHKPHAPHAPRQSALKTLGVPNHRGRPTRALTFGDPAAAASPPVSPAAAPLGEAPLEEGEEEGDEEEEEEEEAAEGEVERVRSVTLESLEAERPLRLEAMLSKKSPGARLGEKWQDRWVALHDDVIIYYKDKTKGKPLGIIPIRSVCRVAWVVGPSSSSSSSSSVASPTGTFVFQRATTKHLPLRFEVFVAAKVKCSSKDAKTYAFTFTASDPGQAETWVEVLKEMVRLESAVKPDLRLEGKFWKKTEELQALRPKLQVADKVALHTVALVQKAKAEGKVSERSVNR